MVVTSPLDAKISVGTVSLICEMIIFREWDTDRCVSKCGVCRTG